MQMRRNRHVPLTHGLDRNMATLKSPSLIVKSKSRGYFIESQGKATTWFFILLGTFICVVTLVLFYLYSGSGAHETMITVKEDECTPMDMYVDVAALPPDATMEATQSIFNCNAEAPSSTLYPTSSCKWFYPKAFFDEKCGTGRGYRNQVQYMQEMQHNRSLWSHMPSIFLHTVSLNPEMDWKWTYRIEPFPRHNLSMIHVHKTGGSSLVQAYRELNHRFPSVGDEGIPSNTYLVYKPKFTNTAALSYKLRSSSSYITYLLDHAVKYKSSWGADDHVILAMVRDPVQRFISSLGQAMGATGSKRNGYLGQKLVSTCLFNRATNDSSTWSERRKVLKCGIEFVKQHSFWFEIHFTPMVLEISFVTGIERDIPIAVIPFEALPAVLYELGADPKKKVKDGSKPGVRPNIVLTEMTVEDFDDEMLLDLCEIYRIDVLFMKHIGFQTRCDAYLSFS